MHGNYHHGDFGLKMAEYAFSYDIPPFSDQSPRGNDHHANNSMVIITTGTLVYKWANVKRKSHWPLCQIFCQNLVYKLII